MLDNCNEEKKKEDSTVNLPALSFFTDVTYNGDTLSSNSSKVCPMGSVSGEPRI
ncbi:MAG: hypothetical protein OEM77_05045 [Nitrosopumilus sp.]|nr:hypothetical protein [Nitrosopumilus sp.]